MANVGDSRICSHRPARSVARRPVAPGAHEEGFTLVEVAVALALLVIMMIPFTDAFVSSIRATADAHVREVGVMLADTDLDQARALDPTDKGGAALYSGHTQAAVTNQWTNYDFPEVSALLAATEPTAVDTITTDPVYLPVTPQTQQVGGITFTVYYYVGLCLEPPYAPATAATCGAYNTAAPFNTATPPAPLATNPSPEPQAGYFMYRVIVDVTWPAPHTGCGTAGCHYVTSTLVNGNANPTFDVNPTPPWINPSSTTQTITVGQPFTHQVVTTAFPPPTQYGNTSLGPCTVSAPLPNGLTFNTTTGVLSGTPTTGTEGTYTYCFTGTNVDGTGNTQTYRLTIVKAVPVLAISSVPATAGVGMAIPVASVTSQMSADYVPTAQVSFSVYGPSSNNPATCQTTTGGLWTGLGSGSVNGSGVSGPGTPFTPPSLGNYWWYASFPGDTDNQSATSICNSALMAETQVENQPILTVSAPATSTAGSTIPAGQVTALLTTGGLPTTATVSFSVYGPSATPPATCQTTTGGLWTSLGAAPVSGSSPVTLFSAGLCGPAGLPGHDELYLIARDWCFDVELILAADEVWEEILPTNCDWDKEPCDRTNREYRSPWILSERIHNLPLRGPFATGIDRRIAGHSLR